MDGRQALIGRDGHGDGPKAAQDGDTPSQAAARPAPLAVALRHDADSGRAPQVVASGRGLVAEQILQLAFDAGVRVREDADLAQILSALDVDSEIPPEAFAAVAEILAYVYKANGAAVQGAEPAPPTPRTIMTHWDQETPRS